MADSPGDRHHLVWKYALDCAMVCFVKKRKELIRRIMLLSHELGHEIGYDETLHRAKKLRKYLREQEGKKDVDLEYALYYMRELLENRYHGKQ